MKTPISKDQCRAARALVDWSQDRLAAASGVANTTIRNFEGGKTEPIQSVLSAIRLTLEAAGVEFIDGGVRLKPKP